MALIPFRAESDRKPRRAHPMQELQREFRELLDGFFGDFDAEGVDASPASFGEGLLPRLDVVETDREYQIACELPGLEEKDIDLKLVDQRLIVRGEKRRKHQESEAQMTRTERYYGSFYRSIPLWEQVDEDKIEAKLKRGVLYITAPKSQQAMNKAKKISIKTEKEK